MPSVTIYDTATGEITGIIVCSADTFASNTSGLSYIAGAYDGDLYYVSSGKATARPTLSLSLSKASITADGNDTANLTGVPSGASITMGLVGGEQGEAVADGTTLKISATIPGIFEIRILKWPYKEEVLHLESTV